MFLFGIHNRFVLFIIIVNIKYRKFKGQSVLKLSIPLIEDTEKVQ